MSVGTVSPESSSLDFCAIRPLLGDDNGGDDVVLVGASVPVDPHRQCKLVSMVPVMSPVKVSTAAVSNWVGSFV